MSTQDAGAVESLVPPPKIELWPVEQLRAGLLSADAATRVHALAMTVQPDAKLDDCVEAIASCVELSRGDAMACQLAAAALSMVKRDSEKARATECLATLATEDNAPAVRIFAAHGMAQLGRVPAPAWPSLAVMLFAEDANMRQVALRAATPFAVQGASFIAQAAAAATPGKWTTEGLAALAYSAGSSGENKQRVEHYVLRSLQGQALLPTGIAGYAALARLNPDGVATPALAKVATAEDDATALAAIQAISQLGEGGKPAIPGLIEALKQTENPEREEAICRALLQLRIGANDVPLPRALQRIETAPDRAVAAHSLLLSLHAKSFAAAARVVAARYQTSGDALKRVLNELHHQLAGKYLGPSLVAAAAQAPAR